MAQTETTDVATPVGDRQIPKPLRHDRPRVLVQLEQKPQLLQGILEQANSYDWQLLDLSLTRGSIPDGSPIIGAIVRLPPTGLLAEQLKRIGCPVVRMGQLPNPCDSEIPTVLPDLEALGAFAAQHFINLGFKHLAYIGHKPLADNQSGFDAFKRHAEANGATCHLLQLTSETWTPTEEELIARYESRAETVSNWLRGLPKPLGLLGYHDAWAAKLCLICQSAGIAVPEDIAILGIGNAVHVCEMAPVPISSIVPDLHGCGRAAVSLLKTVVDGLPPPPHTILVPPIGVVERQSTDVLAVSDTRVAQGMRYMWQNLAEPLTVEDVARELDISRSTLERAFRKTLGRSVNEELRRKRLEFCGELLRSTDLTIEEITEAVGFRSKGYLHRVFRETHGMTPTDFRRMNTGAATVTAD